MLLTAMITIGDDPAGAFSTLLLAAGCCAACFFLVSYLLVQEEVGIVV
jgi:hypothetical protein